MKPQARTSSSRRNKIGWAVFLLLSIGKFGYAADIPAIDSIVEKRDINITITSVIPTSRYANINLFKGGSWTFKIHADSVSTELPYIGRVYSATRQQEGGIVFNGLYTDYSSKYKPKREIYEITFRIKSQYDTHSVSISLSTNGYATIYINSNYRETIGYYGQLTQPPLQ